MENGYWLVGRTAVKEVLSPHVMMVMEDKEVKEFVRLHQGCLPCSL